MSCSLWVNRLCSGLCVWRRRSEVFVGWPDGRRRIRQVSPVGRTLKDYQKEVVDRRYIVTPRRRCISQRLGTVFSGTNKRALASSSSSLITQPSLQPPATQTACPYLRQQPAFSADPSSVSRQPPYFYSTVTSSVHPASRPPSWCRLVKRSLIHHKLGSYPSWQLSG